MSTGIIHSTESCGTVDGPGVRFVIFFKGCPMRCAYCHNPDTWTMAGGTEMTVQELLEEYDKKAPFYKTGGITATGGEPMVQIDFLTELFTAAHNRGINTCLDTSGVTFRPDDPEYLKKTDKLLEVTDLVMLDIKHIDPIKSKNLVGFSNERELAFAKYLSDNGIHMWIRQVLIPGYTDDESDLLKLKNFISGLENVDKIEILPYHDMGKYKWKELGLKYELDDVRVANDDDVKRAKKILGIS